MAIRLLDKCKIIDDEVYRWVSVCDLEIPEFYPSSAESVDGFFRSDMSKYVKENGKEIELFEQQNVVGLITDVSICCYMKEKDITYLSLKYA